MTLRAKAQNRQIGPRTNGNQNCTTVNQIPDVTEIIRDAAGTLKALLPRDKSAWELHILTGQSLSMCQKILSGHRELNLEMVIAVLRTPHGYELLRALLGDEPPVWFGDIEELRDNESSKVEVHRLMRSLERREQQRIEKRAQG